MSEMLAHSWIQVCGYKQTNKYLRCGCTKAAGYQYWLVVWESLSLDPSGGVSDRFNLAAPLRLPHLRCSLLVSLLPVFLAALTEVLYVVPPCCFSTGDWGAGLWHFCCGNILVLVE